MPNLACFNIAIISITSAVGRSCCKVLAMLRHHRLQETALLAGSQTSCFMARDVFKSVVWLGRISFGRFLCLLGLLGFSIIGSARGN